MTGVHRATAWRDTRRGPRRWAAELPHKGAVFGTLLGLLAVLESLGEFVAAHGSIPRMFSPQARDRRHRRRGALPTGPWQGLGVMTLWAAGAMAAGGWLLSSPDG